jgi:curved DNA-binding protein CbpA
MPSGSDVDLYGVLGVPRDASAREIRHAYRRLARRHHPDLNPDAGGSQRFASVAGAYEILQDPVRRARYDRTLSPSPAVVRRRAYRQPARSMPVEGRLPRRGTLELSPDETAHVAHQPLALRDGRGQTILLPAGTRDGDRITVLHDGRTAVLTVRTNIT